MPEDVEESVTYTGEASMVNPTDLTQEMGPFELNIERTYKGIDTVNNGEAVIIDETAVVTINSPLTPLPETENFKLAVDRNTYEHLDEDGGEWDYAREGQFTFGLNPAKDDIEFWLHDINDTVTAKYDGATTYRGINVNKYNMKSSGQVTKNQGLIDKYTGMAYYYGNSMLHALYYNEDSEVYVDEVSGVILYIDRNIEFSGTVTYLPTNETFDTTFTKMSYTFDDSTTDELVEDAKELDSQLNLYGTTIPTMILVSGVLVLLIGITKKVRDVKKNKNNSE